MADIPKGGFKEREPFETWLNSLPEQDITPYAIVLAHRAAMRVLPFIAYIIFSGKESYKRRLSFTLVIIRANLISGVASTCPTPEIKTAASAAAAASPLITSIAIAAYAASASAAAASAAASFAAADAAAAATSAATLAAATSAATLAATSAAASFWSALTSDAIFLQQGGTVKQLTAKPIWLEAEPDWWRDAKSAFQSELAAIDKNLEESRHLNWLVWLDWYNARAAGRPAFDLPLSIAESLEMRIALGDNGRKDFWEREAHEVNAEIAGWVEAERELLRPVIEPVPMQAPEIPAQAIAPLETEIVDNQVVVHASHLAQSPTGTASIHKILRAEAEDLACRLRGQMPDAANLMDACRENLGADVQNIDVYGVDYFWGALSEVSSRANEQLMDDAAGRLSGFILNLERFLKQFPEWVAYHRQADLNAFKVEPKLENIETAKDIAIEIVKYPDTVSSGVGIYLGKLALALSDGHAQNPETAYGFLRSLANVSQSIGTIALGSEWKKDYVKQLHTESSKLAAKGTITLAATAATAILTGLATELIGLGVAYPYMFGWVGPLLRYLGVTS